MTRTELINAVIKKNGYTSYLEIGMGTGRNFKFIRCQNKVAVDPDQTTKATVHMTSDEYFASTITKYDCIFSDGLHELDQARRDLINSWGFLKPGGTFMMHDTNPHSETITHVPRDSKEWCGDVYKLACQIGNPGKFTYEGNYGVTVLKKQEDQGLLLSDVIITWEEFNKSRKELLNLKSWEQSLKLI